MKQGMRAKLRLTVFACALTVGISSMLAACGGGSSGAGGVSVGGASDPSAGAGGVVPQPKNTPVVLGAPPVIITGTAALGAPFPKGSLVTAIDATGATYTTFINSADGTYSLNVPVTAKAPLVLMVSNDEQGLEPMISVASELKSSTANITPATHVIASLLSGGDPSTLAASIKQDPTVASPVNVEAQKATFVSLVKDLGVMDSTDPMTGQFQANGSGYDKVLDSVISNIKVNPESASIVINPPVQARADNEPVPSPVVIKVAAKGETTVMPTAEALSGVRISVNGGASLPDNTSGKLVDLLARLNKCYALPQSARVSNTASAATAGDVVSDICLSAFYNNNPSLYKHNSYIVGGGEGNKTAFSNIFHSSGAYGVVFAVPKIQYIVKNNNTTDDTKLKNGDVVFTARWVAPFDWVASNGTTIKIADSGVVYTVARAGADGKLSLIGNQSDYDIDVNPVADFRQFVHPNMSKYSYVAVGYNLWFNSKHNVSRVVVTSPKGEKFALKPIMGGGYDFMGLAKMNDPRETTTTTVSMVNLAARYLNSSTKSTGKYCGKESSNHPRDIEPLSYWSCKSILPDEWSDDRIAALPDQGVWQFDLYDANGKRYATEYRRTTSRPPTIAEVMASQPTWPKLTAAYSKQLTQASAATGFLRLSDPAPAKYDMMVNGQTGRAAWAWQLASDSNVAVANKWTPSSVKIFGKDTSHSNFGFSDQRSVYSTWRMVSVGCSANTNEGGHCSSTATDSFKSWDAASQTGVEVDLLQLSGYDTRSVLNGLSIQTRGCINPALSPTLDGVTPNLDCIY